MSVNNDWVIFTLLGLGIIFWLFFYGLQRGISFWEFLLQRYEIAQNTFPSWILISIGNIVVFSVLFSQSVPIVPHWINSLEVNGFVLNKIGFMLLVLSVFFLLRFILTVLFYFGIGQIEKITRLIFIAQKFYFVQMIFGVGVCIFHYYFKSDGDGQDLRYIVMMLILLGVKNLFYLFHKEKLLPREWYYKILYICTLQILPVLAIWKFMFLD